MLSVLDISSCQHYYQGRDDSHHTRPGKRRLQARVIAENFFLDFRRGVILLEEPRLIKPTKKHRMPDTVIFFPFLLPTSPLIHSHFTFNTNLDYRHCKNFL